MPNKGFILPVGFKRLDKVFSFNLDENMSFQKTLAKVAEFKGIGVHKGEEVVLRVFPAPVNCGFLLKRSDLQSPMVPMLAGCVAATSMATTMGGEDFTVSTVEHALAAANALELDNLIFEVNGREFPILDGSSKDFVSGFESSGLLIQEQPKNYIVVKEKVEFSKENSFASLEPYMGFKIEANIDFPHPAIGQQSMALEITPFNFKKEISSARTFGFMKDVELLRKNGLALGGSMDNAIILDESKVLNPGGLRFENEFVRHKILDAVGDMATLGQPVRGLLRLHRAGHDLMNKLVLHLNEKSGAWTERSMVY